MPSLLAPCIAIVGPPNSGKSGLVDRLNHALQLHPEQPAVHVVKGSPDGTGRYLLHSPGLREALKGEVKGEWTSSTGPTISNWITSCRGCLELVLVDLGGQHAEGNKYILRQCSHYIVLSRSFDDPLQEDTVGMASWIRACAQAGLRPVARLRSIIHEGQPAVQVGADGALEGAFRGDVRDAQDRTNDAVIGALVERLLTLRVARTAPAYVNLKLARDWELEDLAELGGRAPDLERMAADGEVVLGGVAPIWAYAAAMHRALDRNPEARVLVFDPKVSALLEIPAAPVPDAGSPLVQAIDVALAPPGPETEGTALRLRIATKDKALWPSDFQHLAAAPPLPEPLPPGPLWVDGPAPIWLHLAYSRWLRARGGDRLIGVWDARRAPGHGEEGRIVFVTGPGSPRCAPKPRAGG